MAVRKKCGLIAAVAVVIIVAALAVSLRWWEGSPGRPAPNKLPLKVKLYYYNETRDREMHGYVSCSLDAVLPVEREIPYTKGPVRETIWLLLKGELTEQERAAGFSTEFPHPEFKFLGANLKNGLLTLKFADPTNFTSGGACRTSLLAAQIVKTAKQFSGVREVRFEPETLFQP
jgi:spore germination protein GerM